MSDKVLVTGGTGFIGRSLVKRLVDAGRKVFVTGREPHSRKESGSEFLARDFQALTPRRYELSQFAAVFHLAAETNTQAPDNVQWQVNCEDAHKFLTACREAGVRRIVYASSCAVYGRAPVPFREALPGEPLNAYGAAKLALDKLVSGWAVGIRPANVYGPGEEHKGQSASMVAQIHHRVKNCEPVTLFSTCQRDLIAVDSIADLFQWAEGFEPGVYNGGTGVATDYLSVAVECSKHAGKLAKVNRAPCPFPVKFQEYTACAVAKTAAACQRVGQEWNPVKWRYALAVYHALGWPNFPTPTLAESKKS